MALGFRLTSDARQKFEIIIDGSTYLFDVYWNTTGNGWFMDVSNSTSVTDIFKGVKVVARIDYAERLGVTKSNVWFDSIERYTTPVDPTRDDFELMQLYTEEKTFVSSGLGENVPTTVVTHNGLYLFHNGAYVTHSAIGI